MKKSIQLLGAITVTGSAMPMLIATNSHHIQQQGELKNNVISLPILSNNNEYKIDIIGKKQEKDGWCGIASLQAFYKATTKKEITQEEIAKSVFKDRPSTWGTDSLHIYDFLDENRFLTNIEYFQKPISKGYGKKDAELFEFQNIIKNSLINGAPILINVFFNEQMNNPKTKTGHTFLIYGIKIDRKQPSNTIYYIWDPATNDTRIQKASSLQNFYSQYMGDIFVGEKIDKDNIMEAEVSFNWKRWGPITNDETSEGMTIQLIKWSNYTDSWENFKNVYKYFEFKDYTASAGGQDTTISNSDFKQETMNIPNEGKIYNLTEEKFLVKYEYVSMWSPLIVISWPANQKANLRVKSFFIKGEYLYMDVVSYTKSELVLWHSWTDLKIDKIKFFRV